MRRNVEVKARVADLSAIRRRAEALSDGPCEVLDQDDTFFRVPEGRLKLRVLGSGRAELITYRRADRAGPGESHYLIASADRPAALREVLSSALGAIGTVRKRRTVFRAGQVRIHLDEVEGLGDFVELEVVLREGQPVDQGKKIARSFMEKLGICEADLVEGAYLDLPRKP
ncbi:MAG: class IV adenylate cyclase [Candidatus Brocadiae bacterium]|nr:class IV adenylate cyclase [Candidatus Brocadiia bacterium]